MSSIYTIEENNSERFDERVNTCLSEGYKILSTACNFTCTEIEGFFSTYQAILLLEES